MFEDISNKTIRQNTKHVQNTTKYLMSTNILLTRLVHWKITQKEDNYYTVFISKIYYVWRVLRIWK